MVGRHFEFSTFAKITKHKNAYISKTMLDRVISMTFLKHRVSLQSSHPSFQNIFVSPKMAAILKFLIFRKNAAQKNAYISKTMLDRADYADFDCHNSIRLEAEHFLNTLALTIISFSGRFVFAVQKHSFFYKRSSSYICIFHKATILFT